MSFTHSVEMYLKQATVIQEIFNFSFYTAILQNCKFNVEIIELTLKDDETKWECGCLNGLSNIFVYVYENIIVVVLFYNCQSVILISVY